MEAAMNKVSEVDKSISSFIEGSARCYVSTDDLNSTP